MAQTTKILKPKETKIEEWKVSELLQDLVWEVKSLHVQLLCSRGWSWHGHWHLQGCLVQVRIEKFIFAEKKLQKMKELPRFKYNTKTIFKFPT